MDRKDFFLEAPWGKIAVVTYNSADLPLVIFCHGRSDSADTFEPLIERLPSNYHYVTFDLPGCGYSDRLPNGHGVILFALVPALKYVADHYGQKPFVFIGHSIATQIGLFYHIVSKRSRITKFVEIDQISAFDIGVEPKNHYSYMLDNYIEHYYMEFFSPDTFEKKNGSFETAPSYTKEHLLSLIQDLRKLDRSHAELVLRRNLRPDPEKPGNFKLAWDQRMKDLTLVPFTLPLWVDIKTRYSPAYLLVISSITESKHDESQRIIADTIRKNSPYFKQLIFKGGHDIHLNAVDKLAPHIADFLNLDLSKIQSKSESKL